MIELPVEEMAPLAGTRPACRALGCAPATIYRRRTPPPSHPRRPRQPPAQAHDKAEAIRVERARVPDASHASNPKRFINGAPQPAALPTAAWINEPGTKEDAQ